MDNLINCMKTPEKIYFKKDWNVYSAPFDGGIEFTRSDIAEQMAKEFAEYIRYNTKPFAGGRYRANKKYLTEADKVYSLDELFTEFINIRKAQKAEE